MIFSVQILATLAFLRLLTPLGFYVKFLSFNLINPENQWTVVLLLLLLPLLLYFFS